MITVTFTLGKTGRCLFFFVYSRTVSHSYPGSALIHTISFEAFARICVTGFLFDPEIKMSSLFSSPSKFAPRPSSRQTSSSRRHSIGLRVREIFVRPFVLHSRTSLALDDSIPAPHPQSQTHVNADGTITEKILNVVQNPHESIRNAPPENTFLSRASRSDHDDPISLPFRLSIQHVHEKTRRGLPFLRQSWTRIDFIAIVSFWIMFMLAVIGAERGEYHIGLFRAMSVLRTTRLLAVTSGTTVSDRSFAIECKAYRWFWLDDNAFA